MRVKLMRSELPAQLGFSSNDYLTGLGGFRVVNRRNEDFGIEQINIRKGFDAPWKVTWVADQFPQREFDSYEALLRTRTNSESTPKTSSE